MLKAITASLLMEQVLAPNFKFKTKLSDDDKAGAGEVKIRGFKLPSSKRVKDIIESDLNDLKATILQDDTVLKAIPGNLDPEVINKVLIPKIIQIKYPELSAEEVEEVRQHVVVDSIMKSGELKEVGDKRFIRMADKFVNIDDLYNKSQYITWSDDGYYTQVTPDPSGLIRLGSNGERFVPRNIVIIKGE
jgi:hypothetical protein